MAIIWAGMQCAICHRTMDRPDLRPGAYVTCGHFVRAAYDPLLPYSDGAMHRACFLAWPLRDMFVERYNMSLMRSHWGTGIVPQLTDDGGWTEIAAPESAPEPDDGEISEPLRIVPLRDGFFGVQANDSRCFDQPVVLSLRLAPPTEALSDAERCGIRIAPTRSAREIFNGPAPGIPLVPRAASYTPDRVEFELDRSHAGWEEVRQSRTFLMWLSPSGRILDPRVRSIHREQGNRSSS